jgi:hypothetical protein
MNEKGNVVIILVIILAVIFLIGIYWSRTGWGYAGYRGYHYGPSLWYWGGPRYYPYSSSMRSGSLTGPRHTGGGLHGGK